jgi:hypothetical protein
MFSLHKNKIQSVAVIAITTMFLIFTISAGFSEASRRLNSSNNGNSSQNTTQNVINYAGSIAKKDGDNAVVLSFPECKLAAKVIKDKVFTSKNINGVQNVQIATSLPNDNVSLDATIDCVALDAYGQNIKANLKSNATNEKAREAIKNLYDLTLEEVDVLKDQDIAIKSIKAVTKSAPTCSIVSLKGLEKVLTLSSYDVLDKDAVKCDEVDSEQIPFQNYTAWSKTNNQLYKIKILKDNLKYILLDFRKE